MLLSVVLFIGTGSMFLQKTITRSDFVSSWGMQHLLGTQRSLRRLLYWMPMFIGENPWGAFYKCCLNRPCHASGVECEFGVWMLVDTRCKGHFPGVHLSWSPLPPKKKGPAAETGLGTDRSADLLLFRTLLPSRGWKRGGAKIPRKGRNLLERSPRPLKKTLSKEFLSQLAL